MLITSPKNFSDQLSISEGPESTVVFVFYRDRGSEEEHHGNEQNTVSKELSLGEMFKKYGGEWLMYPQKCAN